MFLTYDDLVKLFPRVKGIKDDFQFVTVSTDALLNQKKGLFIPLFDDSGQLKDAIQNGAIGAIWDEKIDIPSYIPNHFPIFYTNDLHLAINELLELYIEKLNGVTKETMNMTKFLFVEEKLLNKNIPSYDKPVLEFVPKQERRG